MLHLTLSMVDYLLTARKFRHRPVQNVFYDVVARLERAAEKGKAIVAAVEGVEKNWGASVSCWLSNILSCVTDYFTQFVRLIDGSNSFIETLRERMHKTSLLVSISRNSKFSDLRILDLYLNLRFKG
ncbi:hypothetical protein H5410_015031 [Solanum commersonii]|uniref:Uncharacterized protein n=1 Tax=Solanum commersonii TaxID=4109 RepID=A0A9J5ZT85_SOLCO|nr:hypothetical protein H5410_015031 [Solanum commersonii]